LVDPVTIAVPVISAAAHLLKRLNPDRFKAVVGDLAPEESRTLDAGILRADGIQIVGDGNQAARGPRQIAVARATFVEEALDEALKKIEPALLAARRRLQHVRQWRLLAQVLTFLGSATLLGTVLFGQSRWQIVAAIFTAATALLNLLADNWDRLIGGRGGTTAEAYDFLSQSVYPARQLKSEIGILLRHGAEENELDDKIGQANILCERINDWLYRVG
jgi:hypothetical protein